MKTPGRSKLPLVAVALVLIGAGAGAWWCRGVLAHWLSASNQAATIVVSGNVEAHQAVLGFKTVQSRIVELPFNEGQWVKAGTLISRVDDSDYRQPVTMAEAALDVQKRQLATAEQNLAAARKTVVADQADLELAQLEFTRAGDLMKKGAGTIEARDQTNATLKKSSAGLVRQQPAQGAGSAAPGAGGRDQFEHRPDRPRLRQHHRVRLPPRLRGRPDAPSLRDRG